MTQMTDKSDNARELLREAKGVIESLDAIINGEISREWADYFGKDWEDMTACLSRITAHLAAPAPEPVARVTYSNWNGVNIEALPAGRCLPVGAELYALPQEEK